MDYFTHNYVCTKTPGCKKTEYAMDLGHWQLSCSKLHFIYLIFDIKVRYLYCWELF